MSRRYRVDEGIIIRRSSLPSGDVVVTLFSERGKWRAIARKGRLPGGNLGRLSLFHDVSVQYYRRRDDDLALLTQVQLTGALPNLSRPDVYPYAHVLAELADALSVDVHLGGKLYGYLASGLRGLNQHPDPEAVALVYAWKLLAQAGLQPRSSSCPQCGARGPLTHLAVAAGSLACSSCGGEVALGEQGANELTAMLQQPVRLALDSPPRDRDLQWLALQRYLAYHVAELRSLAVLRRPKAGARVATATPGGTPEDREGA